MAKSPTYVVKIPDGPLRNILPGMILEWANTPNFSVVTTMVVEEIDREHFAAWVRLESGTRNRLSIEALRKNARLVGWDVPKRDVYDRFVDWVRFDVRDSARRLVSEPRYSAWDLYLGFAATAVVVSRAPIWAMVPIIAIWILPRLWAGRAGR